MPQLNLSFIPPTFSKKVDAEIRKTAFSIWSVPNSATKGIQDMQAVSNLPISAWLPTAAHRDAKSWWLPSCKPCLPLLSYWSPAKSNFIKDPSEGLGRQKNTTHESINISFNFTQIFRPRCNLDIEFSEPIVVWISITIPWWLVNQSL